MEDKIEIEVIRTTGAEEKHLVPNPDMNYSLFSSELEKLLNAKAFDTINLRNGRIMYVDDDGYETEKVVRGRHTTLKPVRAKKPVNEKATKLYHSICVPGTTHQIVGDVAIVRD